MVLHRDEAGPRHGLHRRELPGEHRAGADVAGLAGPDHVVQRVHRLLDRGARIEAVDLVQVDMVLAQAAQRRVDRGHDVLARQPLAVLAVHRAHPDLGGQDVLLARREQLLEQRPGEDLARASVVDVGGVEERDATLDGVADDRRGGLLVERPGTALVRAVAHHAQAYA